MKKRIFIVVLAVIFLIVMSSEFNCAEDSELDNVFRECIIPDSIGIEDVDYLEDNYLYTSDTNEYDLLLSYHIESTAYV